MKAKKIKRKKAKPKKRKTRTKKKPVKARKATVAQSIQRQKVIYKMLVEGRQRPYISQYVSKRWGLDIRQIDRYIALCNEQFREIATFERHDILGQRIEQVYDLYIECRKAKARQTALACIKELDKLQALIDINIDFKGEISLERKIEGMTDEEINQIKQKVVSELRQAKINIKGARA